MRTGLFQGFKTLVPSLSVSPRSPPDLLPTVLTRCTHQPQYVAKRILDTVEHRDALVVLPWYVIFAIISQVSSVRVDCCGV